MREAYIVSAVRTAVGRGKKGALADARPESLAGVVVKEAVRRAGIQDLKLIDDLILGCAMPEATQGMNIARIVVFLAGLPFEVPAMTINRFCSSGLQAIAIATANIMAGFNDLIVAGGVESMSTVPMGGYNPLPHPAIADVNPEVFTPMGNTAENVAVKFGISRTDQDEFAYNSHMKAAKAWSEGRFKDQIIPFEFTPPGKTEPVIFDRDECVRAETTLEALAKLKPVFSTKGTVTAGNSSPINDGAAAVVIASGEMVKKLKLQPMGILKDFVVAGVEPEIMGIGPSVAIPKLLNKTGLKSDDVDVYEMNEAFAAQAFYCQKKLELNPAKVNPNGGAVALGHPLGATGAKLTVQILYDMAARSLKKGVVSMCIGGGMGAAGLIERV
jgi:acetyl-CoA acyltransferase